MLTRRLPCVGAQRMVKGERERPCVVCCVHTKKRGMEADKETAESYLKAVLDVIEQGDLESSRAKVSYPLS